MTTALGTNITLEVTRLKQAPVSFNRFCHARQVNDDRMAFHAFAREECGIVGDLTWDGWWFVWDLFRDRQDTRDLAETQRDALT